ncbi:outer membrane protein assembly factor BamD [Pseudoxanthomonas sp. 10H]|uniref:hypothetical protein n=1 Tax=Pseudoxanthomonas sp. 10H TaxID=3242729 RepID=UPI0035564153
MKRIFLLATVIALLSGCGSSQKAYEQEHKRVMELEAQVKSLTEELDEIKFGANRLLAQAESAYAARNDAEARKLLVELQKRHPSSSESTEASALLAQVDRRIADDDTNRKQEEERKAAEERQARARATGNMKMNTDEIEGTTWVTHRKAPTLGKYVSTYFGSKSGSAANYPLRLRIQYYGDDWLFVRSVTVKADDKVYNLGALDFERDHSSGTVWEWVDIPVKDHAMLNQWMNAERVVVRFNGDQYYDDFTLPKEQQARLLEVYQAWKAMGGKP